MAAPTVYLFFGDNPLALAEAVDDLIGKLGASAEFNEQRFSGRSLDFNALIQACTTPPFLAERRLVVLEEADQLPTNAEFRQRFEDLLGSLPDTTALVLIEQEMKASPNRGERGWRDRPRGGTTARALPRRGRVAEPDGAGETARLCQS